MELLNLYSLKKRQKGFKSYWYGGKTNFEQSSNHSQLEDIYLMKSL